MFMACATLGCTLPFEMLDTFLFKFFFPRVWGVRDLGEMGARFVFVVVHCAVTQPLVPALALVCNSPFLAAWGNLGAVWLGLWITGVPVVWMALGSALVSYALSTNVFPPAVWTDVLACTLCVEAGKEFGIWKTHRRQSFMWPVLSVGALVFWAWMLYAVSDELRNVHYDSASQTLPVLPLLNAVNEKWTQTVSNATRVWARSSS